MKITCSEKYFMIDKFSNGQTQLNDRVNTFKKWGKSKWSVYDDAFEYVLM